MSSQIDEIKVVALAGGVGGAKLVDGFAQLLPATDLIVIVNTGDDFEHLGLYICPDLDTVCYTLAGRANPDTGWGRANETWNTLDSLREIGGPDWFRLGDLDLGTHLERTRRLKQGDPLSTITRDFCGSWGVETVILPMSDERVPTLVISEDGEIPFQEYYVRQACQPVVSGFQYGERENISPAPGVLNAFDQSDLVVICPSNPWVSIMPILSLNGIRGELREHPVAAVSPIIAGRALKGPAAKMCMEMGITPSPYAIAEQYRDFLDLIFIDQSDHEYLDAINELGIQVHITDTIMKNGADRRRLAEEVVQNSEGILKNK